MLSANDSLTTERSAQTSFKITNALELDGFKAYQEMVLSWRAGKTTKTPRPFDVRARELTPNPVQLNAWTAVHDDA